MKQKVKNEGKKGKWSVEGFEHLSFNTCQCFMWLALLQMCILCTVKILCKPMQELPGCFINHIFARNCYSVHSSCCEPHKEHGRCQLGRSKDRILQTWVEICF